MAGRKITPKLERALSRRMSKDRKGNVHRPTVAVMIQHHETKKFLIIFGRADVFGNAPNPGIVKGGVDRGELPLAAARREIEEELGIHSKYFEFLYYYGSYSVKSLKKKEGFPRKRYYVFHAVYDGPSEFSIDTDELSHYAWMTLRDAKRSLRSLARLRSDKQKALLKIFEHFKKKIPERNKQRKLKTTS